MLFTFKITAQAKAFMYKYKIYNIGTKNQDV